jgi:hypothetical protein
VWEEVVEVFRLRNFSAEKEGRGAAEEKERAAAGGLMGKETPRGRRAAEM